jgi:threonine dehydrogenase-like Zn-dependent dehydrogenase
MGEIVEVGSEVKRVKKGDRVVVPFTICCGQCFYCRADLWSLCDNTNPNAIVLRKVYGSSGAGLFGYSHLYGGYAGGQAQYARVPFADVGPIVIENGHSDEQVLFLSDILPTGYMAAENCNIQHGDVVAVWGCGPVGQFAIRSAFMLGAERVIAIDHVPERLELARKGGADVLDYADEDLMGKIREQTGGRGPDSCMDAVGMETHGTTFDNIYDHAKQALFLETDRPGVLRRAIMACRKGGTVSIPGVYGGFIDKFPIGSAFAKGLTFKMGQTNAPRYLRPLLNRIQNGEIDPSFVISHRIPLENAPSAYQVFNEKQDGCTKVVLRP